MKLSLSKITLAINIFLLVAAIFLLIDLHRSMKERQVIVSDLPMVNDVKYGLFNVDQWKLIIADIVSKKIAELEFDGAMRQTLKAPIESALNNLIDNIQLFLNQEKASGNWFVKTVKTVAYDIVFDAEKFKKQIPLWTNEIISQMFTLENRNKMKKYLKDKMDSFLNETIMLSGYNVKNYITNKYDIEDYDECVTMLTEKSNRLTSYSWKLSWLIISIVVVMFVIYFANSLQQRTELHYYTLFTGVLILLIGGLLTPMIDIDARIANFEFLLLGENIHFENQVIFFQSKSIFNVVTLLIKEGDIQTFSVGILIFTFSIIFPTIKLVFSALSYRFSERIKKNKIAAFFVLESAKWSMTDVMVLAIFMSYIGFSSIIGAQLAHLSEIEHVRLLTTHEHTTLQMGFFIFTAYCFGGIVFGYVAKQALYKNINSD